MNKSLNITPVSHATMVLELGGKIIYTDPAEGEQTLEQQPPADIILITDIHQDHFKPEILPRLVKDKTVVVAPPAVAEKMPQDLKSKTKTLANGESADIGNIKIQAVAAYNIPEKPDSFHPKGRGNGYIIEADGMRVYLSGDTSATPEMKLLQNINHAFLCMNLPYTMDVEEAAKAVLAFKPKAVTPYHYRGHGGFSDVEKFKQLVNSSDPSIEVDLINFYSNQ